MRLLSVRSALWAGVIAFNHWRGWAGLVRAGRSTGRALPGLVHTVATDTATYIRCGAACSWTARGGAAVAGAGAASAAAETVVASAADSAPTSLCMDVPPVLENPVDPRSCTLD